MALIKKWLQSSKHRIGLDILFAQAPLPSTPLRDRLDWFVNLVNWIRTVPPELESEVGRIPVARLKYILLILDRNPELKMGCASTLRSIIRDTSALELFLSIGIPSQNGLFMEVLERIHKRFLPEPPRDRDLVRVFSETFRFETDAEWIRQMDGALFGGWAALFRFKEQDEDPHWNSFIRDARDAVYLATQTIRGMGLSHLVRSRVAVKHFSELPFYSLMDFTRPLLEAKDEAERVNAFLALEIHLAKCIAVIDGIHAHFREEGVSIAIVYETERLKSLLVRTGTLARLLAGYQFGPEFLKDFFGMLVHESIRSRSIAGFITDNFNLLSKKIIATNAEVGEHYITRDRGEYFAILGKAWGGGAITGLTILVKFLLSHLSTPLFVSGFLSFLNYSVSFVGMQLLGFTLATKQPAMTATVLAEKIKESKNNMSAFVDESAHLIRSQTAAIIGNLSAVIPIVALLDLLYVVSGGELTDKAHAQAIVDSFSLFGWTPVYAAWTGVLLWLSSVFSGAFGNWMAIRRLPEALIIQPRLLYIFGASGAKKIAMFVDKHGAGLAANVSLAFLLGMSPQIASFFGLPLDVRHVTLSTGSLTAAALELRGDIFRDHRFWHAVLGICSMGILNLAVAFALALTVAMRAQHVSLPKHRVFYVALLKHFLRHPLQFIFPPKTRPI